MFRRLIKAVGDLFRGKVTQNAEPAAVIEDLPDPEPQPVVAEVAPVPAVVAAPAIPAPPAAPPKLNVTGAQLNFLKRAARHEAAHVVVGDEIKEEMEWVNVMGMPGADGTKVYFNYSAEALQILKGEWNGYHNFDKMKAKLLDLATCFVAGHLIESELYPQCIPVSLMIQQAGNGIWGTLLKSPLDHHRVAWLMSLIDKKEIGLVKALEKRARDMVDKNRDKLKAIEEKLIEQGYIDGDEFKAIRGK